MDAGQRVQAGAAICILEAMKDGETTVSHDETVTGVSAPDADVVETGQPLPSSSSQHPQGLPELPPDRPSWIVRGMHVYVVLRRVLPDVPD